MSHKIRLILMIAAFANAPLCYAEKKAESIDDSMTPCMKGCHSKYDPAKAARADLAATKTGGKKALRNCLNACKKNPESAVITQQKAESAVEDSKSKVVVSEYEYKPVRDDDILPGDNQLDNQLFPYGSTPVEHNPGDPTGGYR
jgi:hypothetical protein